MRTQRGFTLIELSVVTIITMMLLGFIVVSLVRSQQGTSLTSAEEILLVDLKQQQLKAMIGDTEGRADSSAYGIRFDQTKYILFHGDHYVEDPLNPAINLDSNMQFNNPPYDVVFSKITGEIGADRIIELKDNTNSKFKRIHLNSLGVITQVDSL
jgi:prepilin-type N-terminal cleavage/methylation domain-containing protein